MSTQSLFKSVLASGLLSASCVPLPGVAQHSEVLWCKPDSSYPTDSVSGSGVPPVCSLPDNTALRTILRRVQTLDSIPVEPIMHQQPAATGNTPNAHGSGRWSVGIGASYQHRTRYTRNPDGAIGIGLRGGDAKQSLGVEATLVILDLTPSRDGGGLGQRGAANFRVNRVIAHGFSVAAGVQNIFNWGGTDAPVSSYVVMSKVINVPGRSPAHVSVGVGNGRFRSEADVRATKNTLGVFSSTAVRLRPNLNAYAEWTGQNVNLGVSLVPVPRWGIVVTPAIADLLGTSGDGHRWLLGVGYSVSLTR